MSKVVIVYALLDKLALTMYDEQGNKIVIKQGDARIAKIMTPENTRELEINKRLEVDLTESAANSHFKEFEEKTNGFVKFFRIAKKKLQEIFSDPVEGQFGSVPKAPEPQASDSQVAAAEQAEATKQVSAVAEIMANAVTTSDPSFYRTTEEEIQDTNTTVVAVVGDKVLPEAGQLTNLVKHAVDNPTAQEGLKNFMERMSAVATTRRHSAEDLMKFLRTADLPFANNGDIIAYKNLETSGDAYVDIHSKRVTQKVGSMVHMDESMVDPNRRNDCSNGLHIASRSYLGGFTGNRTATVVCRIRPEDVIAVPEYNNNKMRVCAYHIIDVLSPEMSRALLSNKPITSVEGGKECLAKYIAGQHIGILEYVKIGGERGANLTITAADNAKEVKKEAKTIQQTPAENVEAAVVVEEVTTKVAAEVDPRAISEQAVKAKAESHRELIARLFKDQGFSKVQADQIRDIKKKSKKSWTVLGVSDKQVKLLEKNK